MTQTAPTAYGRSADTGSPVALYLCEPVRGGYRCDSCGGVCGGLTMAPGPRAAYDVDEGGPMSGPTLCGTCAWRDVRVVAYGTPPEDFWRA